MVLDMLARAVPAIVGLLLLGTLILLHEWGHFIAARRCGIKVLEFAMGMGPKLIGFERGGTLYSVRLLPVGGFCRMLGDEEPSDDEGDFNNKPIYKRMIVILAGASVNIIVAVLLFLIVVAQVGFATTYVQAVLPEYPAETAGILPGDRILKIGNGNIHIYEDMLLAMRQTNGKETEIVIQRDGQKLVKVLTPLPGDGSYVMGISSVIKTGLAGEYYEGFQRAGFFESLRVSFWQMFFWIKTTFYGIGEMVTLNMSVNEMAGPIGVVSVIGETIDETYEKDVKESIWVTVRALLNFAGMLSASIGIFNLLPIPALDGGRFVFLMLEAVRRKPVPRDKEGLVHLIGFVMLMALGAFIAYNDILRIL